MMMPRFFLGARPLRALLEVLSIAVVAFVILGILSGQSLTIGARPFPFSFLQATFTFLGVPFCMLWLAARLKRFPLSRWQRYPLLLLLAAALSLILNYLGQISSFVLFQNETAWQTNYDGVHGSYQPYFLISLSLLFAVLVYGCGCSGIVCGVRSLSGRWRTR